MSLKQKNISTSPNNRVFSCCRFWNYLFSMQLSSQNALYTVSIDEFPFLHWIREKKMKESESFRHKYGLLTSRTLVIFQRHRDQYPARRQVYFENLPAVSASKNTREKIYPHRQVPFTCIGRYHLPAAVAGSFAPAICTVYKRK